jgi:hypothetical protein
MAIPLVLVKGGASIEPPRTVFDVRSGSVRRNIRPAITLGRPRTEELLLTNPVELTGGCLCGGVRYRIAGTPVFVAQCYCRDCQKATGTGHTTVMGVMEAQLSVAGQVAFFANQGSSGSPVRRHFCPICAGRLYTAADSSGPMRLVQVGSLDDPSAVSPTLAIFVKDAPVWDRIDPALTAFAHLPPHAPDR